MLHLGDIQQIRGDQIPAVDCVTAGSPCQDVSIAGNRDGIHGTRSGLFFEFIRVVREMRERDRRNGRYGRFIRPRYVVFENVPGIFSSNEGKDFQTVLTEIARLADPECPYVPLPVRGGWTKCGCLYSDMGTWSIAWRVHDAQFWGATQFSDDRVLILGTPQRRKRIALVADFGGLSAPEILFERKGLSRDPDACGETRQEATGGSGNSSASASGFPLGFRPENVRLYDEKSTTLCNGTRPGFTCGIVVPETLVYDARGNGNGETVPTLTGDHQNRVTDYTALCVGNGQLNQMSMAEQANTLDTMHDQQAVITFDKEMYNCGEKCTGTPQAREDTVAPTCRADAHPSGVAYNAIVRRLTPLECERLQGYPDGWTLLKAVEHMSDAEYAFWCDVLLQKAVREQKARDNGAGVLEMWRYMTPKNKAFDQSREKDDDGGYWENTGKPYRHKTMDQMIRWYNKSFCQNSDSARYKALGNSIALPFWQWLARRICAQYERTITMASLFDGIGGFPLVFQRCGAIPLWASEIEDFPIAVTRKHFPEV